MHEPGLENTESSKEQKLQEIYEKISKADGQLISLPGVLSPLGENYFMTCRYGFDDLRPKEQTAYLNIDIFVEREGSFVPVGMRDFEIYKSEANGNKQRHLHMGNQFDNVDVRSTAAHVAADIFYSSGEGLKIIDDDYLKYALRNGNVAEMTRLREAGIVKDESMWTESIYKRHGLGTLMTASALLILHAKGVETIKSVYRSEAAIRTWRRFGWPEDNKIAAVEELAKSPVIRDILLKFV